MSSTVRPWAERSNSIGFVPGKKKNRREALRAILEQLPMMSGQSIQVMMASGEEVATQVDDLCGRQLSNGGLVKREGGGPWVATDAASAWLKTADDERLAEHLHNSVKLFGELLASVEGITNKEQVIQLANEYGLRWSSTDQLYRRLGWMEVLGLLERWGSNKFVITERGRSFLGKVQLATKEEALGVGPAMDEGDVTLLPASENLTALIARYSKQAAVRKAVIGYIPRGRKAPGRDSDAGSQSPFDAIRNLMELVGEGATVDEYYSRCVQQLGLKRTSANQTLQTVRHMRVFDMVAYNQYGVDSEVAELLELGNEVDFVRFLHSRYAFVGELIRVMDEATPVPDAARIATDMYGHGQIDTAEVRTRLGFMAEAGLVERVDWTRYRATPLGRLLADELTLQEPSARVEASVPSVHIVESNDSGSDVGDTIRDLREHSHRSDTSERLEISVASAFTFLGFDATHLGGSGRTDVVIDAHLPDNDGYRAIIDAKASASGSIGDNAINFDTLKGHRKRHRADYGMVVGPEFANRVREWASDNQFILMTVEELCSILERHAVYPLSLPELRGLFDRTVDDLTDVEEQYSAAERSAALMSKILELLYVEAREDDPLLDGHISLENVNFVLRKEISPRPSAAAIEECLQFLSHDLIRGVVKTGTKYKLADAPSNIMRRLAGLGRSLENISVPDV